MEIKETYEIKDLYEAIKSGKTAALEGKELSFGGFVRSNRFMGKVGFLSINDGSCFANLQVVYQDGDKAAQALRMGASVIATGKVHYTPEANQPFELDDSKIKLEGDVAVDYPLQKKKMGFDYLRTLPQWRMKTNTFNAVFRVRSTLAYYIHEYFHKNGYYWIHTPELTANDCEGEGQVFDVYAEADKKDPTEYFGKENVHLTVSGQLHVEPFALTYGKVYTFGPTFRAEKSNTTRHAAEFWMVEPEIAWAHLDDLCAIEEDFLKYVVRHTMEDCSQDMAFFYKWIDKDLEKRLSDFLAKPFPYVEYADAIKILQDAVKNGHKFEVSDISFGLDLGSEHERYLTEQVFKGPIFLRNYPKEIKAFYMKQNPDNKTVGAVDLLVPGIGELCGGSERESDYGKLLTRMNELKMPIPSYQWYLDLRKNGSEPHSGFGLGFERLVMLVTGIENIRDVLPYPRCYKDMMF
ncbi:MAG: asparagine--tRNA ligase [Bacilli bacterium]